MTLEAIKALSFYQLATLFLACMGIMGMIVAAGWKVYTHFSKKPVKPNNMLQTNTGGDTVQIISTGSGDVKVSQSAQQHEGVRKEVQEFRKEVQEFRKELRNPSPEEVESELDKEIKEALEAKKKKALDTYNKGFAAYKSQSFRIAIQCFKKALAIIEISSFHLAMGNSYFFVGQYKKASLHYQKALNLYKKRNNRHGEAASYAGQALILKAWGKLDEAMRLHKKEEKLCEELGDKSGLARTYGNQALILKAWGKLDEAMRLHKKEEKLKEELGDKAGLAITYGNQGIVHKTRGDLDKAKKMYERSLFLFQEIGARPMVVKVQGWLDDLQPTEGAKD